LPFLPPRLLRAVTSGMHFSVSKLFRHLGKPPTQHLDVVLTYGSLSQFFLLIQLQCQILPCSEHPTSSPLGSSRLTAYICRACGRINTEACGRAYPAAGVFNPICVSSCLFESHQRTTSQQSACESKSEFHAVFYGRRRHPVVNWPNYCLTLRKKPQHRGGVSRNFINETNEKHAFASQLIFAYGATHVCYVIDSRVHVPASERMSWRRRHFQRQLATRKTRR
jgi:hypothetical protein